MNRTKIEILEGIKNYKKSIVISGRDTGTEQRKKFSLDSKDVDHNNYIIVVPDTVIVLASSFFLGAFGDSVRKLGDKDKFLTKYEFPEKLMSSVNDGIKDALNNVDIFE